MKYVFLLSIAIVSSLNSFSQSPGNCLQFDGTDDYVQVADHSSIDFGTGSLTIEFWMKTTSSTGTIINKKAGSGTAGFRVFLANGSINVQYNSNTAQQYGANNLVNNGVWHHIAIVCYPTTNEDDDDVYAISVYYDGIFSSTTVHGYLASMDNAEYLFIGKSWTGSFYTGYLEEVRVWNIARNQTQIQSNIYTQISGSATGLKAYWRFNESSGATAADETSNNNDGTLVNMSNSSWVTSNVPMPFQTSSGAGNWSSVSSWTSGIIPNSPYAPVQVDNNINVDNDYEIGKLTNNANITINATASLKLNDQLVNSGTIKVLSNSAGDVGSFIDNGSGTFGTNVLSRYISDNKWHYISTPISSAAVSLFSGGSLWDYSESNAEWVRVTSGNMIVSKGYDAYFKNTGAKTVDFSGTFNTGSKSISLSYTSNKGQGYNLVGNPYPSTIDWDASSGWSRTNVNGAVYIWNPNTSNVETFVSGGGSGTSGGSRYIPATQGFFVICTSNTSLGMNNSVRVSTNRELRDAPNSNELRIKVSGHTYEDEALIRFNPDATQKFDAWHDAYKMYSFNKLVPQIYTLDNENTEYAINSIKPLGHSLIVPLNFYVGIEGEYVLSFDKSNLDENCDIVLQDLVTGLNYDINSGSAYTFNASFNDIRNRFLIHFNKPLQLFNDIEGENSEKFRVYSNNGFIYVYLPENTNSEVMIDIYDLSGKKVWHKKSEGSSFNSFDTQLNAGIYIATVKAGSEVITKKITIF